MDGLHRHSLAASSRYSQWSSPAIDIVISGVVGSSCTSHNDNVGSFLFVFFETPLSLKDFSKVLGCQIQHISPRTTR